MLRHHPGRSEYDRLRLPWRRNADPRPDLVVPATCAQDVLDAVRLARDKALPLGVQCTGHGTLRSLEGGLLLVTSGLDGVTVDPERRVAWIGGGAVWRDVVTEAQRFGLAPLSGSSPHVGVAGYTLGGGLGWFSRKHGFAADSLLEAEVVTADGQLRVAGPDTDPDLWWALRGGSGNFGVATRLTLRLFPVGPVYGGTVFFPFDLAGELLARYREWSRTEPPELTTILVLLRLPDSPELPRPLRGSPVVVLRACYLGAADEGRRALAPLLGGARPLFGGFTELTFAETGSLTDPQPGAQRSAEHTDLFRNLPDELIDLLLGEVADGPVSVVEVRHWAGALATPRPDSGPAGHCDAPYSVIAIAPELTEQSLPLAESRLATLAEALRPHATGRTFLNFLADPNRTATAYSPDDRRRLTELKKVYDPENFFRLNHNISPTGDG